MLTDHLPSWYCLVKLCWVMLGCENVETMSALMPQPTDVVQCMCRVSISSSLPQAASSQVQTLAISHVYAID